MYFNALVQTEMRFIEIDFIEFLVGLWKCDLKTGITFWCDICTLFFISFLPMFSNINAKFDVMFVYE